MPVNQNLSNFSDIAFQTAFVVYAVALVFSLVYYGRLNGVITARREHAEAQAKTREDSKASVKATASVAAQVVTRAVLSLWMRRRMKHRQASLRPISLPKNPRWTALAA